MSDDAVIEARVAQALESLGAKRELMRIDPDFADTAVFCEKYGVALDHSGNTIIVASKKEPKQFCACLVLATTRLDVNHAVRRLMEVSRVSFATAEETAALTGMMIGGGTPLAPPPRLPPYPDERIIGLDSGVLGGGGFILGVGVGWGKQEFEAIGVPFEKRGAMTNDYLQAIKACWTQDIASYEGRFVTFRDVPTAPKPVRQPGPPIWVGGSSEAALSPP